MYSYERRQRRESAGVVRSAPLTAAAQPVRHQQQQPSVDASSKAKPTNVSADWVAVVVKVLDELEKWDNPEASISISVNHVVSFPLT